MSQDLKQELDALRQEVSRLSVDAQRRRRGWQALFAAVCVLAGVAVGQPVITTLNADEPALASDLNASLTNLRAWSVPRNAVLFFDGPTCPTGWSVVTAAQGRALVGRPSNGTLGRTFGGAINADNEPSHAHATTNAGTHNHGGYTTGFRAYFTAELNYNTVPGYQSPYHQSDFILTDSAGDHAHGVTGTGASAVLPYVYFTPCRKD